MLCVLNSQREREVPDSARVKGSEAWKAINERKSPDEFERQYVSAEKRREAEKQAILHGDISPSSWSPSPSSGTEGTASIPSSSSRRPSPLSFDDRRALDQYMKEEMKRRDQQTSGQSKEEYDSETTTPTTKAAEEDEFAQEHEQEKGHKGRRKSMPKPPSRRARSAPFRASIPQDII